MMEEDEEREDIQDLAEFGEISWGEVDTVAIEEVAEGVVNGTLCDVLPGYELGMHGVFPVRLRASE